MRLPSQIVFVFLCVKFIQSENGEFPCDAERQMVHNFLDDDTNTPTNEEQVKVYRNNWCNHEQNFFDCLKAHTEAEDNFELYKMQCRFHMAFPSLYHRLEGAECPFCEEIHGLVQSQEVVELDKQGHVITDFSDQVDLQSGGLGSFKTRSANLIIMLAATLTASNVWRFEM